MIWATLLCACLFAVVHLTIARLKLLRTIPRSGWLSFAGGVAVAYVFLHILPELALHQESLAGEQLIYAVSLLGLAVFYGLERSIKVARAGRRGEGPGASAGGGVYHLHLASFPAYNVLIGYLLLHREDGGWLSLGLYVVAMALHFVTTDFGLREDHEHRYDHHGRWILAAAMLAGWGLGAATQIEAAAVAYLFAFLAGGVVLNVLKEELPEERQSRFGPFVAGAAGYAALMLLME